ncbi:MAG: DNA polymerase Y family protein [Candidatus Koribacter versatilis]|uniref:DNA polymerase Y family protein n=1 Tax=Candidatus Korobacter versatilis TaxID=658062 RepID=A0A932A942_9BACT|nr:DNA polymerase Y family protein [Candidatus Koribacter versatilis]
MFAALYIPDLPVEAIVRAQPALREHAVAVLAGKPPLEKVMAANERARSLGIAPGMTRLEAESYRGGTEKGAEGGAENVRLLSRSPAQEAATYAALLDAACAFSPRVEATAADTVVLDLAGLEALFGPPAKLGRDLARRASGLGVEAHVAVAANPDAAVYAARGFAGVTVIPPDQTADRLGLLPVEILAPEAERPSDFDGAQPVQRFAEVMERWGMRTLRSFAALPSVAVVERLGQRGLLLQRLARGEWTRTLVPFEPPLVFEETCELEYPVENLEPLAFLLHRMLEQLCGRLKARSLATNELRLTCELEPMTNAECRMSNESSSGDIRHSSFDNRHCRTLRLPVPMQDPRVLLKLLQLDLAAHPPGAPVAKLALRAGPVQPRATQEGFFVPVAPEPEKLELLLARVAAIVGAPNIGAPEVLDSHRPDAHRIRKFQVSSFESQKRGSRNLKLETRNSSAARLALRLFRPPLRARVEMQGAKPVRVSFLEHARAEVTACAGPWRTSGEWWTNDGWQRDEWDVSLKTGFSKTTPGPALYRMYRDVTTGDWFVYGAYD